MTNDFQNRGPTLIPPGMGELDVLRSDAVRDTSHQGKIVVRHDAPPVRPQSPDPVESEAPALRVDTEGITPTLPGVREQPPAAPRRRESSGVAPIAAEPSQPNEMALFVGGFVATLAITAAALFAGWLWLQPEAPVERAPLGSFTVERS